MTLAKKIVFFASFIFGTAMWADTNTASSPSAETQIAQDSTFDLLQQVPPRFGMNCRVEDKGHEEHFRGHRSCRECLALHGECIETCEGGGQQNVCSVNGYDRRGRARNFVGSGYDRGEARREAMQQCRQSRFSGCRLEQCYVERNRGGRFSRDCRFAY